MVKLRLLGTGTSQGVPVIGCDCETCRSTDPRDKRLRVAAHFRSRNTSVVVDAGPDFRQQMLTNEIKWLDALLVTHEHNDHIAGLDDLRTFCFRQRAEIPVFALPRVVTQIKERFAYAFSKKPYPGVPRLSLHTIKPGESFRIGELEFLPIPIMHGKLDIVGFRCGSYAYLTDVKTLPESAYPILKDLDTLVISALQPGTHHSHLNLEEALEEIDRIQPKEAYLTHLSHLFPPAAELESQLPSGVYLGVDGGMV
ncbi:MAG: MBL fold metallo-hydrolase [Bacteroidota bacterium]